MHALSHFKDYRICHNTLTFSTTNSIINKQSATISPQLVDQHGLIGALTWELAKLDTYLIYNNDNAYQGFKIYFRQFKNISRIECNYAFTWFVNIINSYGVRKVGTDNLVLYDSSTNLIGFSPSTAITTKAIFPLVNGGIIRLPYHLTN